MIDGSIWWLQSICVTDLFACQSASNGNGNIMKYDFWFYFTFNKIKYLLPRKRTTKQRLIRSLVVNLNIGNISLNHSPRKCLLKIQKCAINKSTDTLYYPTKPSRYFISLFLSLSHSKATKHQKHCSLYCTGTTNNSTYMYRKRTNC